MDEKKPNGKKYLLYIHSPEFLAEKRKSKLVNKLLAKHYRLKTKKVTVEVVEREAAGGGKLVISNDVFELCEHGKEPLMCMRVGCRHNPNN